MPEILSEQFFSLGNSRQSMDLRTEVFGIGLYLLGSRAEVVWGTNSNQRASQNLLKGPKQEKIDAIFRRKLTLSRQAFMEALRMRNRR